MANPVAVQPGSIEMDPNAKYPPPSMRPVAGLDALISLGSILVKQKTELFEAFSGFETANKYQISNEQGQPLFFAAEGGDCCTRMCCGNLRSFEITIMDNQGNHVMTMTRPWRPCSNNWMCCCKDCLQMVEVQAPPGNPIGYVQQLYSCCVPEFEITNVAGQRLLMVKGTCCQISCCTHDFPVLSADGEIEVGKVQKSFSGFAREMFTDADNFGICFPMDLDVKCKATLIAACFLIDFMFFEHPG